MLDQALVAIHGWMAGRGRALLLMRRGAGGLVGAAGLYFLLSSLAAGS